MTASASDAAAQAGQSAARRLDRARRDAALRGDPPGAFPARLRAAPWPRTWRRSRRSPATTAAPSFANTIAALERSGRALSQVSAVFHALAGAHTNDAILALEREMSPRLAAHRNRIQLHGGLYARIKALWDRRGELGLVARAGARAGALRGDVPPRRRRPRRRRQGSGSPRSGSGSPRSAPRSARTCSPTSSPMPWCWRPRTTSPGSRRRGQARRAQEAAQERGHAGQIRHHAGAFERRAVPAVLDPAGPAGEGLPRLDRPRRRRRGDRQQGDHRRDGAAARRAGAAARLSHISPAIASTTPWRRRRRRCAALLERVWTPARARAMADRDALQALAQAEGGNFALAPWDWRYYAEKLRKARFDIDASRDRALSRARQHDRSGLRHRRPPVRPYLPRAPRRAGVASRRAGLGGHRPRAAAPSACSSATISPGPRSAAAPG